MASRDINILVGDKGSITAELVEVPWDKAFIALLDMKILLLI